MEYEIYVVDTETTGLDVYANDPIEISICRFSTNEQKTWFLKPLSNNIDQAALKVNGYKIEDLLHQTKEGKEKFKDPKEVIVDIENWVQEDNLSASNRILLGQNIAFDKYMLEFLWKKCEALDSFPFGKRSLDTSIIEFFMDFANSTFQKGYSLSYLTKKYGIKNEKAHSAEADVKATKEVFEKQLLLFKK